MPTRISTPVISLFLCNLLFGEWLAEGGELNELKVQRYLWSPLLAVLEDGVAAISEGFFGHSSHGLEWLNVEFSIKMGYFAFWRFGLRIHCH